MSLRLSLTQTLRVGNEVRKDSPFSSGCGEERKGFDRKRKREEKKTQKESKIVKELRGTFENEQVRNLLLSNRRFKSGSLSFFPPPPLLSLLRSLTSIPISIQPLSSFKRGGLQLPGHCRHSVRAVVLKFVRKWKLPRQRHY